MCEDDDNLEKCVKRVNEISNSAPEYEQGQLDHDYRRVRANLPSSRPVVKGELELADSDRREGAKAGLEVVPAKRADADSDDDEIDYGVGEITLLRRAKAK